MYVCEEGVNKKLKKSRKVRKFDQLERSDTACLLSFIKRIGAFFIVRGEILRLENRVDNAKFECSGAVYS